MTDDSTLRAAHAEIRRERERLYLTKHPREFNPTDKDLNWPEPMVSVTWGSGYITMTLDAYQKLKAKDKKKFNEIGGLL